MASVCLVNGANSFGAERINELPGDPVDEGRSLSSWLGDLGNTPVDPTRYEPAARAVRQMGTNALPLLLGWVELGSDATDGFERPGLAVNAMRELGEIARPAIPELTRLLSREQSAFFAAQALVSLRCEAPVVAALTNRNQIISHGLVIALASDRVSDAAVGPLVSLLGGGDPKIQCLAAFALRQIRKGGEIAVPALKEALTSSDPSVRRMALTALCEFELSPRTKVSALIHAADDRNERVRSNSVGALGIIANGRLGGTSPDDRQRGKTFGEFESYSGRVVATLILKLKDGDEAVRGSAAAALGQIGPVNPEQDLIVTEALERALKEEKPGVRSEAGIALDIFRRVAARDRRAAK